MGVSEDVDTDTTLFIDFSSNSSYKIKAVNSENGWFNPRFDSYDEEYLYQYCIDEFNYANVNL